MLNRRNLRIKAMQTLFAYQQVRISDQQIAVEQLEEVIKELPDKPANATELIDALKLHLGNREQQGKIEDELIAPVVATYHDQINKLCCLLLNLK